MAKGPAIEAAVDGGAALLAVCGGYQLLGRGYLGRHGDAMPGIGLFPHETVAGERRMIGDVLLECELVPGERRTIAGFENHAGRRGSTPAPSRSAVSSPASATTANRATRAVASAARSARTCTAAAAAQPVARRLAALAGAGARERRRAAALEPLPDRLEAQAHAVSRRERARDRGGRF